VDPDFAAIEPDALRLLEMLCRQPSVSAQDQALQKTADLVEELLAEAGFDTRQLRADSGPPAVYGEQRGQSDYTLLLYNHYDVQPVEPLELWESPPFEPALRDAKLFARGAADNKGELAVRLAVVRAFREQMGELPIGIRWIVEGEEEVGSPHFDEIVRRNAELLRADGCLWEGAPARLSDGRPNIGLGFKGALGVRLDLHVLRRDAHSAVAAVAPSAAWRMVEALSTLRERDGSIRIPGFYDSVLPPTDAERRALAEESDSVEEDLRTELETDFIDGLSGAAWRERFAFGPTCNIGGLSSGYTGPGLKTVLTAEASAIVDFRLVPNQHPEEILELLQSHLRTEGFGDIEVTVLVSAEAAGTPIEHPFVQRIAEVAQEVSGAPPSITPRVGATLPIIASLERHVGVPGVAAPDNPFHFGARTHAPNEHVRIDDIGHAVRFTHALFVDLASGG
jgi:acetylornithine deacetylase/succinyl-diaminopimelate desuccinylase-like protein